MKRERSPEITPQAEALEEKIKETAVARDRVTEQLFNSVSGGESAREFVEKTCKLLQIEPPKPEEPLATHIYRIQNALNFPKEDKYDGCDGKLGPYTFNLVINKFPVLNPSSRREMKEGATEERRKFVEEQNFPTMPAGNEVAEKKETQGTTPEKTVTIGDSLTVQYARHFYSGAAKDKYKQYKDYFEVGRSIVTMRRNLEKNCPRADTYVIGAAANDIFYRGVDRINLEFIRIIDLVTRTNPNAKIVLLTLHGDNYTDWRRNPRISEKIESLNSRLKNLARNNVNVEVIDIRQAVIEAESSGKKILAPDKLHYSTTGSKAVAGLIKDYLATGRHGKLTEYT